MDVTSPNVLDVKKGKSRDVSGQDPKSAPAREMYYGGGYASLKKYDFSWLQKPVIVCCDRTDCGSLFHSVGEAIAKPCLPMAFL